MPTILNSRLILIASEKALNDALDCPELDAVEIAARLSMFGGLGYYVERMTKEQRRARIKIYVGTLASIPAPFSDGAFDEWFNRMSRAPSPGDICNAARALVKLARERLDRLRPVRRELAPIPREFTAVELAHRRAFCDAIMIEFGFKKKGS